MLLLDSSFLIAYHNDRDVHHQKAKELMAELLDGSWSRVILLEYVFLEVMTVLQARRGLATANRVAAVLLSARELELLPCSDFFLDTLETFRSQSDAALSFVDAALVTQALRHDNATIATFDRGIQKVGGVQAIPAG